MPELEAWLRENEGIVEDIFVRTKTAPPIPHVFAVVEDGDAAVALWRLDNEYWAARSKSGPALALFIDERMPVRVPEGVFAWRGEECVLDVSYWRETSFSAALGPSSRWRVLTCMQDLEMLARSGNLSQHISYAEHVVESLSPSYLYVAVFSVYLPLARVFFGLRLERGRLSLCAWKFGAGRLLLVVFEYYVADACKASKFSLLPNMRLADVLR